MSSVILKKCSSYEREEVFAALSAALEMDGEFSRIVTPGKKVLVKANLLLPSKPDYAATTHPEVIRALVRIIKAKGAVPSIGDSPGNAYANLDRVLRETGMQAVAEEENIDIVRFEKEVKKVDIPGGQVIRHTHITAALDKFDVIISAAKLKTHNYTLYTGAVKNMFGVVTGFHKAEYHLIAPHPMDFQNLLLDLYSIATPHYAVIDAVWGMEGHGPSGGTPRKIGVLLAGKDAVSVDSLGARLIGYAPRDIDMLRLAEERGLGICSPDRIKLPGDDYTHFIVKDYKRVKDVNTILKYVPRFLYKPVEAFTRKMIKIYPYALEDKCTGCKVCFNNCPAKAITMENNYPVIEYDKCIKCYCCHELCPERAYVIKRSWLAEKWEIGNQDR